VWVNRKRASRLLRRRSRCPGNLPRLYRPVGGALGACADTVAGLVSTAGDTAVWSTLPQRQPMRSSRRPMGACSRTPKRPPEVSRGDREGGAQVRKRHDGCPAAVPEFGKSRQAADRSRCLQAEPSTTAAIAKAGVKATRQPQSLHRWLVAALAMRWNGRRACDCYRRRGCMVTTHDAAVGKLIASEYGP